METLYRKEQILKAFKEGKTIQSRNGNDWKDFIPQNQVDVPNLDYGGIDYWRIKPVNKPHISIGTIKSDNTQTLANALQQIEKLEAEKKELLEMLEDCRKSLKWVSENCRLPNIINEGDEEEQIEHIGFKLQEIESLIQKHKQ